MNALELYNEYKPLLFSIAYRLLGSVTDAEDVVQETFLAWSERTKAREVFHPKAYLCRIVCNKCADRIRLAERQKETYVGTWLPEPFVSGEGVPEDVCLVKESLHTAYLLLLQELGAVERTVFVLRQAFEMPYPEIAVIIGKSVVNVRKIFSRAKRALPALTDSNDSKVLEDTRQSVTSDEEAAWQFAAKFARAVSAGDVEAVVSLLGPDAVYMADGGGKAPAARKPIVGAEGIAGLMLGLWSHRPEGVTWEAKSVNGMPGFIFMLDGRVTHVLHFEVTKTEIRRVYVVTNPDKLKHL